MSEPIFTRTEADVMKDGLAQSSRRCEELQQMLDIERGNTLKQIEKRSEILAKLREVHRLIGMNEDEDSMQADKIISDIIREGAS